VIYEDLPNAVVQLQARYKHCDEVASEKCLSAMTSVRAQARRKSEVDLQFPHSPSPDRGDGDDARTGVVVTIELCRTSDVEGDLRPTCQAAARWNADEVASGPPQTRGVRTGP
jgi:hypothetical protein